VHFYPSNPINHPEHPRSSLATTNSQSNLATAITQGTMPSNTQST